MFSLSVATRARPVAEDSSHLGEDFSAPPHIQSTPGSGLGFWDRQCIRQRQRGDRRGEPAPGENKGTTVTIRCRFRQTPNNKHFE